MSRRLAVVLGSSVLALTASLTTANAAASGWKGPTPLPAGSSTAVASLAVPDPAGGALLYYSDNGVPTLSKVSATGSVGPATAIPSVTSLGNAAAPGRIAFLPDGGAIVTWTFTTYGPYMAYRTPGGRFGTPVALPSGFDNLAVRTGEVLTEAPGGGGIDVESWKLTSSGRLTLKSGPTSVYTGQPLFDQAWLALDPSGSAELVVLGSFDGISPDQVSAAVRTAKGKWLPQKQLSTENASVQTAVFATAPGGRAVVDWVDAGTATAAQMYGAVRRAGHPFGGKVAIGSVSSTGGASIAPSAAAGADGTLVIGSAEKIYATNGVTFHTRNTVRIVAPKGSSLTDVRAVKGSTTTFSINSLGAGDDSAIVGFIESTIGPGNGIDLSSYSDSQSDSASVFTSSPTVTTKQFGASSGVYDPNGGDLCPCAQAPPPLSVSSVALDPQGLAVAVGQLVPGGALSDEIRRGYAGGKPTVTAANTVTATSGHASVTVRCAKAACAGTLALSAKVGKHPATLAKATYAIKASTHKTIRATLTKAGRKALTHAKKHPVHATLVVTVKGGAKVTEAVTVT